MSNPYTAALAALEQEREALTARLRRIDAALEGLRDLAAATTSAARPAPAARAKAGGEDSSSLDARVLNLLETATEPLRAKEVATLLKSNQRATTTVLAMLARRGRVVRTGRGGGRYTLARKEGL